MTKKAPSVFIVSAPSGTGKTTLNRRLTREHPHVEIAVSLTTRPIRKGEVDGEHYHFVTREEFNQRIIAGDMLEVADVFGNQYGTPKSEILRIQSKGHTPILEIDVQGWKNARSHLDEPPISIFIVPPDIKSLWRRLENRGTDTLEGRWKRLQTARDEIADGKLYEYFIINDNVDHAFEELKNIVVGGKPGNMDNKQGAVHCAKLLAEFTQDPWLRELEEKVNSHRQGGI